MMGLEIRALSEIFEPGLESKNGRSSADKALAVREETGLNQRQFLDQYRLSMLAALKEDVAYQINYDAALSSRSEIREEHTLMPYEVPLRRRARFIDNNERNEEKQMDAET